MSRVNDTAAPYQRHFREIDFALHRIGRPDFLAEDVRQVMREKLFVARGGRPPHIAAYAARGPLRGWFRAAVARTIVNLATRGPRESLEAQDHDLLELPLSTEGAEICHLRCQYSAEVAAAFPDALARLTVRERALLRQHYLDGVTLDQLSTLYAVHRATTKRQLASARSDLFGALRNILIHRLKISESEFDSLIQWVRSQLDFTLRHMFTPPERA